MDGWIDGYIDSWRLEVELEVVTERTSGNLGIRGIDGSRAGEGCCGGVLPRDCLKWLCLTSKIGHPGHPKIPLVIIIETVDKMKVITMSGQPVLRYFGRGSKFWKVGRHRIRHSKRHRGCLDSLGPLGGLTQIIYEAASFFMETCPKTGAGEAMK